MHEGKKPSTLPPAAELGARRINPRLKQLSQPTKNLRKKKKNVRPVVLV